MACLLTLKQWPARDYSAASTASYELVETVPSDFRTNQNTRKTYEAWIDVINSATTEICIAAYYSTIFCHNNADNTCQNYGNLVVQALEEQSAAGVGIRLLLDAEGFGDFSEIEEFTAMMPTLQVQYVNYSSLFSGVMHSKIIIADGINFYLGSANFDWRALTEVREIGVYV